MLETNDQEIWKEIPNTEGLYWASSLGRIKSVRFYLDNYKKRGPGKGKPTLYHNILNPGKNRDGYLKIKIIVNGKPLHKMVHRLIAETWLTNPLEYSQVHHKNCLRDDNRIKNLMWCSVKYNSQLENKSYYSYKSKEVVGEEEIWKLIPDTEGLYFASNLGRIKTPDKFIKGKGGCKSPRKGRILQPAKTQDGYLKVSICLSEQKRTCIIHRLVALAFLDNPENLPLVHHKNGNRNDNRLVNIEWCTAGYNMKLENKLHEVY